MGAGTRGALSRPLRRAGPAAALALAAQIACAAAATAQVRDTIPRRDTIPEPDTTAVAQDTAAVPPAVFVPFPGERRAGWVAGAREWDRAALARAAAVSLVDLLAQMPGVLPLRTGVALQPESAAALGLGGARTIVELDGYELDPLVGEALDLSTFEIASLDWVRIERHADVLRIRMRSLEPVDPRPQSRIEAGIGEPNASLFRGTLLVPRLIVGPLGFAVERTEFEGAGVRQPATSSGVWAKWGHTREAWGVQAEFRGHTIDREAGSPAPLSRERSDVVLRARMRLADGLVSELFAGRSTDRERPVSTTIPDSLIVTTERAVTQAGARVGWAAGASRVQGAVRYRDGERLPGLAAELEAGTGLLDRVFLSGGVRRASWEGNREATALRLHASAAPVPGLTLFGEVARGEWGGPAYRDTIADAARIHDRTAYRAGAEAHFFGITAGGAFLRVETDSVTTYALAPDSVAPVVPGGSVTGWEAHGRVPLLGSWLSAAGSYTTWVSGNRWAYLPASQWRAALEVHTVPLPTGNLEVAGRGEAVYRGVMQTPPAPGQSVGVDLPARTVFNAWLTVRIIDVHIFVRFDDLVGNDVEDVRGRPVRGPRVFYGVKWDFWN